MEENNGCESVRKRSRDDSRETISHAPNRGRSTSRRGFLPQLFHRGEISEAENDPFDDHISALDKQESDYIVNTETWIQNLEPKTYGSTDIAFPFPSLGSQRSRQNFGTKHAQQSQAAPFPPTNPFGPSSPSDVLYYSPTAATAAALAESRTMDIQDKRVLRGDFIKVSKSIRTRSPSKFPRPSEETLFQQTFTDSQMERLSGGIFSKENVAESDLHQHQHFKTNETESMRHGGPASDSSVRSRSPLKAPSRLGARSPAKFLNGPKAEHACRFDFDDSSVRSPSPVQETTPQRSILKGSTPPVPQSPLVRRMKAIPKPIDTEIARRDARQAAIRNGKNLVIVHCPPPATAVHFADNISNDGSVYSDRPENQFPTHVSPLRIKKRESLQKDINILQGYRDWRAVPSAVDHETSEKFSLARVREPETGLTSPRYDPSYTPISQFLKDDLPTARKTSKTLIGHNGWLESTSKPNPVPAPARKPGFISSVFRKAKTMMSGDGLESKINRKSRDSEKSPRDLAISMNPREQSLMYGELEYVLTSAVNDYLDAQFKHGRLDTEKLRKIAHEWQQKGRPKVLGFRYDLETQLDLVRIHVDDFRFYGRPTMNTQILGIIDMMKTDARALRVRTFCQPDTVIAKQLLDSQNLFNVLGCPEPQQVQLAEITAFFKATMERERHVAQLESPAGTTLRSVKSHSGEKWQAAHQVRRIASHGAVKPEPSVFANEDLF